MDTNLQVLTSLKANIDSQITGLQAQSVALNVAIDIETKGYQTDQTAIAAAVASQVGDIQTENATLTIQATTDATTIATLQGKIAQIQTILTDGSGSDNQIQEITALLAG